jgi:hypothetical protein
MSEQENDLYCRMVARGDIVAADLFMQACLNRRATDGVPSVLLDAQTQGKEGEK